jgi:Gram-negative bacterial TonB protein C-terminal
MIFKSIRASLALLLMGCSINVIAQTPSSGLPTDPAALMRLARDRNGLIGSDIKPWHIRGTYHSFDAKGAADYEGTYEEWRVSATRYKLSYKSPRSTQTDYATGTVLLRDGATEWQTGPELLTHASLLEPLPDVSQLNGFTLQSASQAVGKSTIECVGITYPMPLNARSSGGFYPTACFEPTQPMLRLYSEGTATRIFYDRIVLFQGHYLARQIQVVVDGKLAADLNLDVIEPLKESPDTFLAPPTTALPVDLTKISIKSGTRVGWPTALKKASPLYPQEAKKVGVEGIVHITAIVGVDGHVETMQVIDGPKLLRQPALDAIHQWVYRPFDIMGQPRRFEVETHVVFRLQ